MILAHGVGGAKDLPIPLSYALIGAVAALAISFVVLGLAWRSPRFTGEESGRDLPAWVTSLVDSGWTRGVLRTLALGFTGYVALAALAGPDQASNPTLGVFYAYLWVGLVPLSLLFGPIWTLISPARIIHLGLCRLVGQDPDSGALRYPQRLGSWPASLGLFAFVWLELVSRNASLVWAVRSWLMVYLGITLIGGLLFGTRWFAHADPFEVYSTLVARLSPFGRRAGTGQLVVRNPLDNLDGLPTTPGLVAVVAVLFGSTAFDSFKETLAWGRIASDLTAVRPELLDTLALLALVTLVGGSFWAATMLTMTAADGREGTLPNRLAHSVVPIVVGYVTAHYLSFLVEYGQQTLINLSDPLAKGWNVFGTSGRQVAYVLSDHPTALAVTKVLAVVAGHILGVVSAHDRAITLLPLRRQLAGQVPLLVIMVGYTVGGLLLLLGA